VSSGEIPKPAIPKIKINKKFVAQQSKAEIKLCLCNLTKSKTFARGLAVSSIRQG
jgi:hypothetical protein